MSGNVRGMLLVAVIGVGVAACKPANVPASPGKISLEFVSFSGSDAELRLGNGTSRAIGFAGARSLVSGSDFWIICNDAVLNSLPSDHGLGERATVPPGETMRVVISGEFQKGRRCFVRLKLRDGTEIDSNEFQP
jgi:hypothetical protein